MKNNKSSNSDPEQTPHVPASPGPALAIPGPTGASKLVEIAVGHQGGLGKTTTMAERASWWKRKGVATTKIDLDEVGKKIGGFHCFFEDVICAPMSEDLGLNSLLQAIDREPKVILVDSAASTTVATVAWFNRVYGPLRRRGHSIRIIGVVTPDPGSVTGFLTYADAFQDRVKYLVVKNQIINRAPAAWDKSANAREFVEAFSPAVINMPYREDGLQRFLRANGLTLADVVHRTRSELKIDSMYEILAEGLYEEVMAAFDAGE